MKDWYKFSRMAIEWIYTHRDLSPEKWIPEMVDRAQSLGIDTLAFDLYHGGYALFDRSVAASDTHRKGADILALLDQELHRRGMRFVLMNMGSHCANYMAREYPNWRVKNASGEPVEFYPEHLMCLNTPYAGLLLQEFAGVLSRYKIDGLYIEGLYGVFGTTLASQTVTECHCDYCRTEFEKLYQYPLPADGVTRDHNVRDFRARVTTDFVRRVRKVIREHSPDTVFMPCPSFFSFTDFEKWGEYADVITLERQWGYLRDRCHLYEIGMSMRLVKALSGCQPGGVTFLAWTVDRDYSHSTPEHYRLNYMAILLYGATPQLHAQTIFELDTSEAAVVSEMYAFTGSVRPALLDAHMLPYAALIADWSDYTPTEGFKGFYKALTEAHVPFTVVSKSALSKGGLEPFHTVLLPDIRRLSDQETEYLLSLHRSGKGIVATYLTGQYRPDGSKRDQNPLSELFGIKGPYGIESFPAGPVEQVRSYNPAAGNPGAGTAWNHHFIRSYYKATKEHPVVSGTVGRLQSLRGSYAEVELSDGEAVAEVLEYDYSMHHRHHPVMGWYPGDPCAPLIVVRSPQGAGRSVFFAADFDRLSYTDGLPGVMNALCAAAVWTAGTPPQVEVNAPPTVEAAIHISDTEDTKTGSTVTVLLMNKTTNELHDEMLVRYVHPVRDITVTLREPFADVLDVRSVAGNPVCREGAGSECVVRLESMKEYDAIMIRIRS